MNNHYAIIMAGGVGTRFWPMSTTQHPKQFLDILGTGETLLQQMFGRKFIVPKMTQDICQKIMNTYLLTQRISTS